MIAYSQEWRISAFRMAMEAAFSLPNPGCRGDSRKAHTSMPNIMPEALLRQAKEEALVIEWGDWKGKHLGDWV